MERNPPTGRVCNSVTALFFDLGIPTPVGSGLVGQGKVFGFDGVLMKILFRTTSLYLGLTGPLLLFPSLIESVPTDPQDLLVWLVVLSPLQLSLTE